MLNLGTYEKGETDICFQHVVEVLQVRLMLWHMC